MTITTEAWTLLAALGPAIITAGAIRRRVSRWRRQRARRTLSGPYAPLRGYPDGIDDTACIHDLRAYGQSKWRNLLAAIERIPELTIHA